jgi:PilZ domain-containing protein
VGNHRNSKGVLPLTLKNVEPRSSERLQTGIPIRVLSFDLEHFETGGFSEDTRTFLVFRSGASVTLRNPVNVGDSLRIVNLTNHSEADFRVVGALGTTENGVGMWALECLERRDDFWGVEWPPPSAEISEATVILQCRACGKRASHALTVMELEVVVSTGIIILNCDPCGKPTFWVDADPNRPPSNFLAVEAVVPPARAHESEKPAVIEKKTEKRTSRRSSLKFSILVRNQAGEEEVSKIVDMSKLGVGVNLFMKLEVGDIVKMICPYDPRSGGIEQTAEVRWRSRYYNQDFPQTYGLRFIR